MANASELFYYAEDRYANRDYQEAITAYELFLYKSKNKEHVQARLLELYVQAGNYERAYYSARWLSRNPLLLERLFPYVVSCLSALGKPVSEAEKTLALLSEPHALKRSAEELFRLDKAKGLEKYEQYLKKLNWFCEPEFSSILSIFYAEGQYGRGAEICKELGKKFPELALYEADFLIKAGQYDAALNVLGKSRVFPSDAALFRKAAALFGMKRYAEGYNALLLINPAFEPEKMFRQLEPVSSFQPFLLARMAWGVLCGKQNFADYEQFAAEPEVFNLLGLLALKAMDYNKAVSFFVAVLKAQPRDDVDYNLSIALIRGGQEEKAQSRLQKFSVTPKAAESMEFLAFMKGRFPIFANSERVRFVKTMGDLERIKKRCRGDWRVFCAFGEYGLDVARMTNGKLDVETIMRKIHVPSSIVYRIVLFGEETGFLELGLEPKKAADLKFAPKLPMPKCRGTEKKIAGNALARYVRGEKGDYERAIGLFDRMKQNKGVLNATGCAYFKLQNYQKAIEYFDRALGLDGNYETSLFNKMLAYASLADYAKGLEVTSRIKKRDAVFFHLRGMLYEYSSQYEKALADYRKALQLKPDFSEAKSHLQTTEAKMKDVPKKEALLQGAESKASVRIEHPSINFSNVGGMKEIKGILATEIIMPLKKPELARKYGKRTGGGYLLYGPPGCGKSFIVEALAGEAKLSLVKANIPDILNMYVGNSEKNLVAVFEEARREQPSMIIFDEIEALGGKREGMDQHWQKTLVNVFLQEMDKIEKNGERIAVFGATNTPWELDIALKRSGRFGRELFIAPPEESSRKEIVAIYTKNIPLDNVELEEIASLTSGFSAANLKSICGKAANRAWKDALEGNERKITMEDFLEAIKTEKSDVKEWMGLARKSGMLKEKESLGERMYG